MTQNYKNVSVASLKAVKSSPLKVQKISKNLINLKASDAISALKFSKLKLAPVISSLIFSAMSNAENNHNMDIDNLVIDKIDIGRSFALKRFATRGRGKSSRILKTFSNIKVFLVERDVVKKQNKKGE